MALRGNKNRVDTSTMQLAMHINFALKFLYTVCTPRILVHSRMQLLILVIPKCMCEQHFYLLLVLFCLKKKTSHTIFQKKFLWPFYIRVITCTFKVPPTTVPDTNLRPGLQVGPPYLILLYKYSSVHVSDILRWLFPCYGDYKYNAGFQNVILIIIGFYGTIIVM